MVKKGKTDMKMNFVRGCDVSALSLGTVQFGIPYGLNQAAGKPERESCFRIMDIAQEHGINWLDTAAAYGDSEEVIGSWMSRIPADQAPLVCSKVNALDHTSLNTLRASLREQVEQSKKRLGLEQIPLMMIHHCEEYFEDPDNMRQAFEELKTSGDIRFSGMSAYAFHDYGTIAQSGFDAVQIPVNLFDWRQIDNGGISKLEEAGMIVFARSVFLQGLVFRKPDQLSEKMAFTAPVLEKFHAMCADFGMDPGVLAMSFALSIPGISSLVIGCRNEAQILRTIQQMEASCQLTARQMEQIHEAFHDVNERVITPSMW